MPSRLAQHEAAQPVELGLAPALARLGAAPDTMSLLTGYLPVEQGVACWAALRAHTDTVKNAGDERTREQIMADTLIERITGQARATDVQAQVAIVIPVGRSPIPAIRLARAGRLRRAPKRSTGMVRSTTRQPPPVVPLAMR